MAKEYIEREAAIAALENLAKPYYKSRLVYDRTICAGINTALREVQSVPAADVRPVVRGKWIYDGDCLICSNCRAAYEFSGSNFCPNCGADMQEDNYGNA